MNGVRVSFFHYPYPIIQPLVRMEYLHLASLIDIGAMKLSAIIGRGTRRDFLDLYEISQTIPLGALLEMAAWKYKPVIDFPFQALKALNYFDDAESEPMPVLLKPVDWEQLREFFVGEISRISRRWLE